MLEVKREPFIGKYDGVTPPTMLGPGDVSGGLNMRKVSPLGGWKARKGGVLHNTTALESGAAIKSLHWYQNDKQGDNHFIAQVNSKLYDSTQDPPTVSGAGFGTDLGVTVGTTPGFSCTVDELFMYADGSGKPIVWGGTNPYVFGALVYDNSADVYVDYTREIMDGRSDTNAVVLGAADDKLYVITSEYCEGLVFDLGSNINSNAVTMAVKAWRAGAWTAVSSLSDGTETGGTTTMAQDGTVTWTRSTSDTMRIIGGLLMGYVYEISFSGAMSGSVDVVSIKSKQDATAMTNKWDGAFEWITGCKFYDQSAGQYQDMISKVSSDSVNLYADLDASTTSDYLYVKTPEPPTAFFFGVPHDYPNSADAQVDLIEYWDGDSWVTCGSLVDETLDDGGDSSFGHSGLIWFNATALSPKRRTLGGDNNPGYWSRVSWDAALSTDTRVYLMAYALFPEPLGAVKGCLEFKNRLFTWGDTEWPNRLRFSAHGRYDCFSGTDSGWTRAIGGADEILCAVKFYNELLVYKRHSIFLLEGKDVFNFGYLEISSTVGVASPKGIEVAEVGSPGSHRDEPMSIAIHQDVDGIYVIDGRKPRKVSMPIDHYFNPEYTSCISASEIADRQSYQDSINNEYHFLLSDGELVYNYLTDEWYPPWSRGIVIDTGIGFKGADGRFYTYGATGAGHVFKLENDTADKNTSNADVAIEHKIKTRAISAEPDKPPTLRFSLRKLWAEFKAQSAGSPTTKTYVNQATSGTTQNKPTAMSMINTGFDIAVPRLDVSEKDVDCFQVEFSLNTIDQEMEIRGIVYEREIRGVT